MKSIAVIPLALVLIGCASQPDPNSASALLNSVPDEETQVVCTKEKPTGSNRLVKVCRPVAGEVDRENTRRDMKVLQRQSEIVSSPN